MDRKGTQDIQSFWVVGVNYKKTDAAARGQFAISSEQYDQLLATAPDHGVNELFILSTCNRTEIYGCAAHAHQLIDLVCSVCAGDVITFSQMAYYKNAYEAAEHLFSVAAGLDSQILGDYEILGQIKKAVKQAKDQGFIGTFTERLVNSVLQSSKAVKTNTSLSGGTVSVSFAAVQYIKEEIKDIANKKIVVLGTGKIGSSTCRNLIDYLGTTNITLINRTLETAELLAGELGLKAASMSMLNDELESADIVLVSTNAAQPVVTRHKLEGKGRKLVIDLSVPCNVAEDVKTLDNITLIDVDALSKIKDETLQMRRNEVPKALDIIEEHITEFKEWYNMRKHVPVLKEVKSKLKDMHMNAPVNLLQNGPTVSDERIQSVINIMATKMRRNNAPGCHYIEAINDFIAHHE